MFVKLSVAVAVAAVVGYVLISGDTVPFCRPLDPVVYTAGPMPAYEGPFAMNSHLASAQTLAKGNVKGCETLAFPPVDDGFFYSATEDGDIIRITEDGNTVEKVAYVGGRTLGLEFDAAGDLILADAARGLLKLNMKTLELSVLTSMSNDGEIVYADDLAIASDGAIYFSDATSICVWRNPEHKWDTMMASKMEALEGRQTGRLIKYDPATKTTTTLVDKLFFANGVALAKDEAFVIVAETFNACVTKYYLKGSQAGTVERCIEQLPGYPDGVHSSPRGGFWTALYTPRKAVLETYLAPFPRLRLLLATRLTSLMPAAVRVGAIVELDSEARAVRTLHDADGVRAPNPTSAVERNGRVYVGNLKSDYVSVVDLASLSS